MEAKKVTVRSVGFKYGLLTFLGLAAYFLITNAMDVYPYAGVRYAGHAIIPIGIALALNGTRNALHKDRLNYLPGLGTGLYTGAFAAIMYAVLIFIYGSMIDRTFIDRMRPFLPFQDYVSTGMFSFLTFGECMIVTLVSTFVLMQFFKRNDPQISEHDEEAIETGEVGRIANEHKSPVGAHTSQNANSNQATDEPARKI